MRHVALLLKLMLYPCPRRSSSSLSNNGIPKFVNIVAFRSAKEAFFQSRIRQTFVFGTPSFNLIQAVSKAISE